VSAFDSRTSRRYAVPPLWTVPLLLIGGIVGVVYVSTAVGGPLGLAAAAVFVAWMEPRADAFVRARDRAEG
jgi:hypothetical protein